MCTNRDSRMNLLHILSLFAASTGRCRTPFCGKSTTTNGCRPRYLWGGIRRRAGPPRTKGSQLSSQMSRQIYGLARNISRANGAPSWVKTTAGSAPESARNESHPARFDDCGRTGYHYSDSLSFFRCRASFRRSASLRCRASRIRKERWLGRPVKPH